MGEPSDERTEPSGRNRRRHERIAVNADLVIDGNSAVLRDLSISGFGSAEGPRLVPDALVRVEVRLPVDDLEISARLQARMIYVSALRNGGCFVDLTASQNTFLDYTVNRHHRAAGTQLFDAIGAAGLPTALGVAAERATPPLRGWRRWLRRFFGGSEPA